MVAGEVYFINNYGFWAGIGFAFVFGGIGVSLLSAIEQTLTRRKWRKFKEEFKKAQ